MKKFVSGVVAGAILTGSVGYAAQYIAETATFKVMVNGKEFVSDKPTVAIDGSTYLPLKAIGEVLGVPVAWNADLNQVEVGINAPIAEAGEYSRTNPAPLNTMQTYAKTSDWLEDDNYSVAVRIMEIARGDKANNMISYGTPDEGYEFMAVKLAFSVLSTKTDSSISVSQYSFDCYSSNNEKEDEPFTTLKKGYHYLSEELYAGGNAEGWIVVQVKKDDAMPKLAYGLDYKGQNGIWFKLYE